jgi:hypothetical protein
MIVQAVISITVITPAQTAHIGIWMVSFMVVAPLAIAAIVMIQLVLHIALASGVAVHGVQQTMVVTRLLKDQALMQPTLTS